jgi:ubiquinone/menaquinone biosynthesis C-methylase UbiE
MSEPLRRQSEPELMDDKAEAEAYARADFAEVNEAFVDRLLELAGPRETAAAVDLGTGPADIPIRLLRRRPGWKVKAVDASRPMIDLARRAVERAGFSDSIEIVLADAKDTGLPAGSAEVVFSNSILHHVSDPAAFWVEVRRLAARGALVFLRDLARPPTDGAAGAIVQMHAGCESPMLQEEYYRSLVASYTPREVEAQLADAGLQGLQVEMSTDRHLDVFGRLAVRDT